MLRRTLIWLGRGTGKVDRRGLHDIERRIPACSAIILPMFKAKTGIDVKVVAQGTGQALDTGRRGDADVVFVHAKAQEEKFVEEGFGVKRFDVMYNDFVLIGPKSRSRQCKGTRTSLRG